MYTYTWKKYLPVIRLLLKRSETTEQIVTLNRTDFERNNKTRKPACSFAIEVINARLSTINRSAAAKDLLDVLLEDQVARGLLSKRQYMISLNADFQLSIKNSTPMPEPATEEKPDVAE